MINKITAVLLVVTMLCGWSFSVNAAPVQIKFLYKPGSDSFEEQLASQFKQLAESRLSANEVSITLVVNKGAVNETQVVPVVLSDQYQLGVIDVSQLADYNRRFQLFNLPFLFITPEAAERFADGVYGKRMLSLLESKGIKGLGYQHNGMKQMLSNRLLNVPSEANGLRFLTNESDVARAQYEAMRAQPITVGVGNVFPALQNNTVDALESDWISMQSSEYNKFLPNIVETNHSYSGNVVFSSAEFWNKLPATIRPQLERALKEALDYSNWEAKKARRDARDIALAGNQIYQLKDQEHDLWMQAMSSVWQQFENQIGSALITAASSQR